MLLLLFYGPLLGGATYEQFDIIYSSSQWTYNGEAVSIDGEGDAPETGVVLAPTPDAVVRNDRPEMVN